LNKINFDSRLLADTDKNALNSIRLLDTDNPLIIPSFTSIRCLVTSNDVIHSWSVAPFGVKMDAIPGRLNQFFLNVNAIGVFYGQCSELCGVYHSFMPVHVVVVNPISFHTKEIYLLCLQHHKN
jgi:heme/copper-type cytochrome/quinol oxidase subunit 2